MQEEGEDLAETVETEGCAAEKVVKDAVCVPEIGRFAAAAGGPELRAAQLHATLPCFHLVCSEDMLHSVDIETNLYAARNRSQAPHAPPCTPVTLTEIYFFLDTLIYQAPMGLRHYQSFWANDDAQQRVAMVADRTMQLRLQPIKRFLHLVPPSAEERRYWMWKVEGWISSVCARFRQHWDAGQFVSVDEAMVRFQWRHHLVQQIKSKTVPV